MVPSVASSFLRPSVNLVGRAKEVRKAQELLCSKHVKHTGLMHTRHEEHREDTNPTEGGSCTAILRTGYEFYVLLISVPWTFHRSGMMIRGKSRNTQGCHILCRTLADMIQPG